MSTVIMVKIFVTGILVLWRVVDSWMSWECLCGHDVCEWCSNPSPAPVWLYGSQDGSVVPYMSTYQHRITNPVTCTLDKL